jgi:mannonate dehydratase
MISGFNNAIYARPDRDKDIEKVQQSIRAAGKAGLPVIEYNWYAHRFMEGYHEEVATERGGAGYTAMDYDREYQTQGPANKLPPTPNEGAHTLHPNDPPVPLSRGSQQIMGTVKGWKHLIEIVNSPSNGITFDCGVTREMGEDPVEVCKYFASRKRINHMHFRNVRVRKPYENYTEVFIDAGMVDMFGVMKELVKNKYSATIYPEHPRALDYDRDRGPIGGYQGGGGFGGDIYDVAYARAMLQAALASV